MHSTCQWNRISTLKISFKKCRSSHLLLHGWFPNTAPHPNPAGILRRTHINAKECEISWLTRDGNFRDLHSVSLPFIWPPTSPWAFMLTLCSLAWNKRPHKKNGYNTWHKIVEEVLSYEGHTMGSISGVWDIGTGFEVWLLHLLCDPPKLPNILVPIFHYS